MPVKEIIKLGGMEVHFSLEPEDTNGQLSMFKCVIGSGAKMPVPHYHESFDETVYGLKGTTVYTIDGKQVEIGPGDSAYIPRGVVHGFENKTGETVEFLAVTSPGAFRASYFRGIAEVLNAGGPPDMAKMMQVMKEHGLVPVKQ